jgi:EAL and modified HD-GYP domain-containing signal transduction protein
MSTMQDSHFLENRTQQEPSTLGIARQPVVDATMSIFGYEFLDRSASQSAHSAASDASLLFNLLAHADAVVLAERKTLFINCTHQSLAAGHLELIQPDQVVLKLPALAQEDEENIEAHRQSLAALKTRGFRLAFNHSVLDPRYAAWLPLASFVKLDMQQLSGAEFANLSQRAASQPGLRSIAEKVETAAQFEQARAAGVALFQGYWFAKPTPIPGQVIRPAQASIIQLINLVRKQASTVEIEEVLKRDPTLSFKLLRFINSAGFGLSCEITSFRHAVMILGLKKLFRWAALLLTSSSSSDVYPAVGQMAIVRGRLMELLAVEMLPQEECDNAFVVGVFSLLDTLLGMPLDRALASVSLPQSVSDALLRNEGVLAPFLALALACESADDEAFARYTEALHLNGSQVNWAHLDALRWAESLVDG